MEGSNPKCLHIFPGHKEAEAERGMQSAKICCLPATILRVSWMAWKPCILNLCHAKQPCTNVRFCWASWNCRAIVSGSADCACFYVATAKAQAPPHHFFGTNSFEKRVSVVWTEQILKPIQWCVQSAASPLPPGRFAEVAGVLALESQGSSVLYLGQRLVPICSGSLL